MKIFKQYLHFILSDYKWYRKKKGGTWYKIVEKDVSGFGAPSEYWDQKKPKTRHDIIIGKEEYS